MAGIDDRGQRDQRRQPVEQRLHATGAMSLAAPDHTETDSSMMLAAAKPATPTRRRKSRSAGPRGRSTRSVAKLGGLEAGALQRLDQIGRADCRSAIEAQ